MHSLLLNWLGGVKFCVTKSTNVCIYEQITMSLFSDIRLSQEK